jgi:tRNA-5-methyluridine54 2-sulfurtransferase
MKVRLRNPDREVELAGGRRLADVLDELRIDPDTVLVIRDGTLVTRHDWLAEGDRLEVRPVISGGAGGGNVMRCTRCREPAVIELRRHNAAFCQGCFDHYVHQQVRRAIEDHDMLGTDDRVLVAVSGGKDSLALWDILLDLGYAATGFYLGLGIGEYSDRSGQVAAAFASSRDADLIHIDLTTEYGFDIPTARRKGSRSSCSVCGLSKRYLFNRVALEHGFDVIATGHNLDDEAATLLGNTLRWQTEFLARQFPVLDGRHGMAKKVKPLYRLAERETAAYAFLRGIDYVVEECPLVAGNTQLRYKDAMNRMEAGSPGTKAAFYLGYVERAAHLFRTEDAAELSDCERCGQPTTGRFCAFCRAVAQVRGIRLVDLAPGGSEPGSGPGPGPDGLDRQMTAEMADEVLPAELHGR